MPLLYSSPILFYPPPPTAPTTMRHFPPQRLTTCPSSSLRRRFASEPNPLPLHSAEVFRNPNWQCNASRPPPYQCRPRSSPLRPPRGVINCGVVCCIQGRSGLVNRLLPGMWMFEMVPATYLLVKPLLYLVRVMEL